MTHNYHARQLRRRYAVRVRLNWLDRYFGAMSVADAREASQLGRR